MLRRFLLIGVGGSGGKTLRYLRRDLLDRLDEAGWTEGIPTGWQFLSIDVPATPDGNDGRIPPQLPDGSYVGLGRSGLNYGVLDNALLGSANERMLEECVGWRPNPDHVRIDIGAGAGQHRTLGRVVALANLTRIRGALAGARDNLTKPETTVQLVRLNRALKNPDENETPKPVVIVISSLAGGAGAGIYLDVCNVVRAELGGDNLMAVLYAPDVFQEINKLGATGVQPNGLAALSELLASYWNNDPPGVNEYSLYEQAGIQMAGNTGRGPRYPFLIGRANSTVSFGGQLDVYAGTASALAAVLTSRNAQENLVAYTFGNWAAASTGLPDDLGLKIENRDQTPLSSLGFASVSLGRDRFGRYVAERLARRSVNHLLRAHWEGRDVPEKTKPEAALEEARKLSIEWLRPVSGLNELGETNNDILEGLQAPGFETIIEEGVREVMGQVAQHGQATGLPPDQWVEAMRGRFNAKEPTILATLRTASEERARTEWVPAMQTKLINVAAEALARDGAPVTVALLHTLREELEEVIVELGREEEQRRRWAAGRDDRIRAVFANIAPAGRGGNQIPFASEFVTQAAEKARSTIFRLAEADLRALAVEMTRDLRENLLAPLERAVAESLQGLHSEDSPPPGTQLTSVIRGWPEGNLLPSRFEPAVNERLVEATNNYPQMFDERVLTTIGGTTTVDAVRQAVRQVVLGAAKAEDQTVIRIAGDWWPARLATSSSPPSKASFEVRMKAAELLNRAKTWVHRPNTALGDYVRENLRNYLNAEKASPTELSERTQRFQGAFTEALSLAAPLVNVNIPVLHRVHGLADARPSYSFTEIPFPEGTPGRQAVEGVMRANSIDPNHPTIQTAFGTGDQAEIDILSTLDAPFEPVVFDSIMEPIAADWVARQNSTETRRSFWKWRRSRPLTRFVPMAPSVRHNFVRGWFIARGLGQVRWTTESQKVEAWVPEERRWIQFPFPLIAPVTSTMDFLPAVLESLPLALVAYTTQGKEGGSAVLPYKHLARMGDDVGASLRPWITTGSVDQHAPTPMEGMGSSTDDPASRRKKVVEYFAQLRSIYSDQIDVKVDQFNFYNMRWVWELRNDIRPILEELVTVAETTDTIEDPGV
jgi:hypothetical protein